VCAHRRLSSGPGWAYEYKLDGYRAAMRVAADGTTELTSRNGIDLTDEFRALTAEGQEGLIAKLRTATYVPGRRTDAWLKHASVGLMNDQGQLTRIKRRSLAQMSLMFVRDRCRTWGRYGHTPVTVATSS
jgi:hypothetical protein